MLKVFLQQSTQDKEDYNNGSDDGVRKYFSSYVQCRSVELNE